MPYDDVRLRQARPTQAIPGQSSHFPLPLIARKEAAWAGRDRKWMVHLNPVQLVQHLVTYGVAAPPRAVHSCQRPWWAPLRELQDVYLVTELSESEVEAMNEDTMRSGAALRICMRYCEDPHDP